MKKKILSLIFILCLILPCAFIFTACKDDPTQPVMHAVTFVYDNGAENLTIEVEEGNLITKPTDPSKSGYTFDGWYFGDFKWGFEIVPVTSDITLTAKWTEIPAITYYTVTFNANNGTENETVQVASGNKVNIPATEPTKEGYAFDGWYFGDEIWSFGIIPITQNVEITAKWNINTYTITYELDGGTNNQSNVGSYTVESNFTFAEPTKNDFVFIGWFIDSERKNEITSTNGYAKNLTVYAKWLRTNTITYNLNGGTNDDGNPTSFSSEEEVVLKAPTLNDEYLTFDGWFTDGEYQNEISTIPVGTTRNLTLWAKWSDIYTVENKGELTESIKGLTTAGEKLKKLTIPSNVGRIEMFAFSGARYLEEVVFGANSRVSIIENCVFENCTKLSSIVLPSELSYIDSYTFSGCTSLTTITIPSSVSRIDTGAFENCTSLESVIFEDGSELEEIGESAFRGCSSLFTFTIPSSVDMIGCLMFDEYNNLESIVFEDASSWYRTTQSDWNGAKAEGIEIDVSNSEANVQNITNTYKTWYLYKDSK